MAASDRAAAVRASACACDSRAASASRAGPGRLVTGLPGRLALALGVRPGQPDQVVRAGLGRRGLAGRARVLGCGGSGRRLVPGAGDLLSGPVGTEQGIRERGGGLLGPVPRGGDRCLRRWPAAAAASPGRALRFLGRPGPADQVRQVALEPGGPLGEHPLGLRSVLGELLGRVVGRGPEASRLVTLPLGGELGAARVGRVLLGLRHLPPRPGRDRRDLQVKRRRVGESGEFLADRW